MAADRYVVHGMRPMLQRGELVLRVVAGNGVENPGRVRTVRQIGPTRMLSPAPIIPSVLTSSFVGARPTRLLTDAGQRTDTTVSSAIPHVTRFAATAVAEPALDMPGSRSVS